MRPAEPEPVPGLLLKAAPVVFLLLWSFGYSVAKLGLRYAEPLTFLALRYVCVLVLMVPLFLILRPPLPRSPAAYFHLVVTGVLMQAVYFGLTYVSFDYGMSAGGLALIVSLQPVVVAIVAPWFVAEQVTGTRWLGLALGLAGAAVVIVSRQAVDAASTAGLVCAGFALVAISAGAIYEKRFGVRQHPVTATLIQFAVAAALVAPLAVLRETMAIDVTVPFLASLAYLVIGNSIIAMSLLLLMIRAGEVSRVSALLFLVPPAAAAIAWVVLGEPMPPVAWLGMAVAGAGVALASRRTPLPRWWDR